MDGSLVLLVGLVLGFILLGILALRFGVDSRSGRREIPGARDGLVSQRDRTKRRSEHHRHRRRNQHPVVVRQLLIVQADGSVTPLDGIEKLGDSPPESHAPQTKRCPDSGIASGYLQSLDLAALGK
jgi:hypothetical protein